MKLLEYQAKKILLGFGIAVPGGVEALSPESLPSAVEEFRQRFKGSCVIKAQVHTGGRGKAGGILKVDDPTEIEAKARSLFGKKLVTAQTGPEGVIIRRLYLEEAAEVKRELYLACVMDRAR